MSSFLLRGPQWKKAREGQWYEIRPFTNVEYKDATDLMRLSYNFIFVLNKASNNVNIYMRSRTLSARTFEVRPVIQPVAESFIHKYNYHLYLRSLLPVAGDADALRDRIYDELASDVICNTSVIVTANHITGNYLVLKRKLAAEKHLEAGHSLFQKFDQKTAKTFTTDTISSKKSEPFYLADIYISTDDPFNATRIYDVLPGDQARFYMTTTSAKKVGKVLRRSLLKPTVPSWLGFWLNSMGLMVVRDTCLRLHELANIVHLPSRPALYSITPGQLADVSQGFELADVQEEVDDIEGEGSSS